MFDWLGMYLSIYNFVHVHNLTRQQYFKRRLARAKQKKKEREALADYRVSFSKVILTIPTILIVLVTMFAFVMMWTTKCLDPLSYLIPSVFAAFSVSHGSYSFKEKSENLVKLCKKNKLNVRDIKQVIANIEEKVENENVEENSDSQG